MRSIIFKTVAIILVPALIASAGDWPAFRGGVRAEQRGRAEGAGYAREWSKDKNIAWRSPLPGPGNSSPVVAAGKVFITVASAKGKERHLLCLDRTNGKELWRRTVTYTRPEQTHGQNPQCSASPAVDDGRVVAWHGSAGVYCYDLDGKPLWKRDDLGAIHHIWGTGSSPIVWKGTVYLNYGPGENTRLIALDADDGTTVWETPEPGGNSGDPKPGEAKAWVGSWSTPQIAEIGGRAQLICSLPTRVIAYDPYKGDILWYCTGLENLPKGNLVYTDPLIGDQFGVVLGGFSGPAIGFRLGGTGDVTETGRLWRNNRGNPQQIGSGVIIGDHLYDASAGGSRFQCLEVATGKILWDTRGPGKNNWGSLVLADGLLYVTDQAGTTHVVKPNPDKLEVLHSNPLGEASNSTPAFSDGNIFLRTNAAVYCIRGN